MLLNRCQYFLRMAFGLHFGEDLRHATLRVDQERRAFYAECRSAIHVFFLEHPKGFTELLVFVAQHRVGEAIFIFKLLQSFG